MSQKQHKTKHTRNKPPKTWIDSPAHRQMPRPQLSLQPDRAARTRAANTASIPANTRRTVCIDPDWT